MSAPPEQLSVALDAIVTRFSEMVRRVGLRHRFSNADIDELMQEVRIRLWRARSERENLAGVPASYVYRTATSAALDLIRRRRARPDAAGPELLERVASGAELEPDRLQEERELQDILMQAVDGLAAPRRAVVRMYLAGHAREAIAELLGWTEAKTRNLLYRGLADLRQRLAERGIGRGGTG